MRLYPISIKEKWDRVASHVDKVAEILEKRYGVKSNPIDEYYELRKSILPK